MTSLSKFGIRCHKNMVGLLQCQQFQMTEMIWTKVNQGGRRQTPITRHVAFQCQEPSQHVHTLQSQVGGKASLFSDDFLIHNLSNIMLNWIIRWATYPTVSSQFSVRIH
jgi:hypothetical protein